MDTEHDKSLVMSLKLFLKSVFAQRWLKRQSSTELSSGETFKEKEITVNEAYKRSNLDKEGQRESAADEGNYQDMEALSRFAASIGHEINNPLTILSMNISRIILRYRKDRDVQVKDVLGHFERMENNIARIKAVVTTLTHLLKNTEHSKMRPINLKKLVDETIPLCQFQTYLDHFSAVDVKNDIPEDLPLVRGDKERLQEIFLNLFVNAYRALIGRKNGFIWIGASLDKDSRDRVIIEFTDNGCGMDEETVKKAFAYGFTTKPQNKGAGIGLYLCRYIATLHGGDINVRSKKGDGTIFTITLPVYKKNLRDAYSKVTGPRVVMTA